MEKRSRRRIRDLVALAAFQGLSENEIGCARISIMARGSTAPCKGRIQMRKTNPLHFFRFGLQRTAGPYKRANNGHSFRFALAIRQPALGLTKKHNFISPNDDRKRRSGGNKQSQ